MNKVLEVFKKYIGYLEKASNKDLEDFTANAGNKNYTYFAREYKEYTCANFQGQAWCAMFVSVCFAEAFGLDKAKELLGGSLYAYCPYGMAAFKKMGQLYSQPQAGDVVFFVKNGVAYHTGFVYNVSGTRVYTIEGNTSGASGVIPNGGGVCKKSYTINSNMFFGRPAYTEQKEQDSKKELIKLLQKDIGVSADGIVGKITLGAVKTLKKGCKNDSVRVMQQLINDSGITVAGGIDGDFGNGTLAAVKEYQERNNLVVDGICGKNTWAALL